MLNFWISGFSLLPQPCPADFYPCPAPQKNDPPRTWKSRVQRVIAPILQKARSTQRWIFPRERSPTLFSVSNHFRTRQGVSTSAGIMGHLRRTQIASGISFEEQISNALLMAAHSSRHTWSLVRGARGCEECNDGDNDGYGEPEVSSRVEGCQEQPQRSAAGGRWQPMGIASTDGAPA